MPRTRPESVQAAIDRLKEGNRRFIEEHPRAHAPKEIHKDLAQGQTPFCVVLGCSDSRVPVETIFDELPGNLFIVRVAGNIVDEGGLASIEYAVEYLNSMLILVIGHTGCGAVTAALQQIANKTTFPGHIKKLANAIAPAIVETENPDHDKWLAAAVDRNVAESVSDLQQQSMLLHAAVDCGKVGIVGAVYDLHTGRVTFQG
jgi:carbonic anhydrase